MALSRAAILLFYVGQGDQPGCEEAQVPELMSRATTWAHRRGEEAPWRTQYETQQTNRLTAARTRPSLELLTNFRARGITR
jgi:hypothetical protein